MAHRRNDTPPLVLTGDPLTIGDVEAVARHARPVQLAAEVVDRVDRLRKAVDICARGEEPIYGVNTGFGSLSRARIRPDEVRDVQRNLIRSHAAGVGEPLSCEVVRAMLVILAASLARGRSGVRSVLIQRILDLLNSGITPVVPSRGSVGASGDLAPLAHIALVLVGEGEASVSSSEDQHVMPGGEALSHCGLAPIELEAKEGLALINGTHMMCAMGALAIADIERLVGAAIASATLAVDACRATDVTLDPRIHEIRRQPGQVAVATRMREFLEGSSIVRSHREHDPRVQDPYCLRATPQVLGAVVDTIQHVRTVISHELGAVTDNPLVFGQSPNAEEIDVEFLSGGNFHGMPLAIALDTLAIALCHLAGIAERRINWLLTASDSENPVNVYLSPSPGLHSGMMIVQYTAAACCNEMQTLATPASVGNIPTSAGIEDYNSMGATAAHQVRRSVELATHVVAMELLVMAEALEYQRPLRSGEGVERIHDAIRRVVPRLTADRSVTPDIRAIAKLITAGHIG